MKKIFAIALALVMVLSMASAFAAVGTCGAYEYTCPTVGCGVAKAEVVQFAANNTVDGYEETACAGVVANQPIFYGVKVKFDDNVNQQWFDHEDTTLSVKAYNIYGAEDTEFCGLTLKALTGETKASDVSGKEYWLKGAWDDENKLTGFSLVTSFDPENCVFGEIAKNTRVEVCANVKYDFTGVRDDIDGNWIEYGDYKVQVAKDHEDSDAEYLIAVQKGADTMKVYVFGGVVKYVEFDGGIYYKSEGDLLFAKGAKIKDGKLEPTTDGVAKANLTCSTLKTMMALIKIDFGFCVDAGVVKSIFGWENGKATCATWNKDAKAIVNAECQVQVMSIPKTGDASVLAWLF